jgi:LuxR family transcriptional regulator, maltose regulon positive regulatory protein
MSAPILTTKLYVPALPGQRTPRPRLIEQLDAGLTGKLTLVCAPAGFGKTTLLAEWMVQGDDGQWTRDDRFAWLSLDKQDNDPTLFLSYLAAALQTVDEELGETALSLLQSPQPPAFPVVLGTVINRLAEREERLVLALDDYHLIENPAIHEVLTYLLDHQPPQFHLAIASRADPPLPLARLRVRQQMNEIRAADLRFTTDEAAAFLQQVWHIDLSPNHVAALEARTEGWIAGLQLAALSLERLQSEQEIAEFVDAFAGSHRYVLDYLADEVLQQQPPEVQTFLLHSSILERLCADLCQAVLETPDAQTLLERIEAANLFLVPLDGRREWFRYHHLFADLLRHRLKQTQPDLLPTLHRRASRWYEEHHLIDEAITHALAAGDTGRLIALIEAARWQVHGRGDLATLRRWLDLLPPEEVEANGSLAMIQVWLLLYSGKMAEAEAYLERVQPILAETAQAEPGRPHAWRGEIAVLQAQIAINHGDHERAIAHCRQAQSEVPADNLVIRAVLENMLGKSYRMNGDLAAAGQAYATATDIGARTGNELAVMSGLCNQAALCEVLGELRQAESLQQKALAEARDRRGRPIPLAGVPLVGLGKVYREWNRLDEATQHLEEALHLGRRSGLEGIVVDGAITLALVQMAQGADAHTTLHEAQTIVANWQEPLMDLRLAAFAARLWLAQGDLSKATTWAGDFWREYEDRQAGQSEHFEIEYTLLARIWLAQDKAEEARSLLDRLLQPAETAGRKGRVIEILTLQALAWQADGESDHAVETLTRALTLAQPQSYVRTFADEGRPLGELLARVALMDTEISSYAAQLLAAFDAAETAVASTPGPSSAEKASTSVPADLAQWLAEPLSERELEVLTLVAQGLTNREVSQRLVVSIATVKKHMENIHGKLYVNNRTQAVARARELGVL